MAEIQGGAQGAKGLTRRVGKMVRRRGLEPRTSVNSGSYLMSYRRRELCITKLSDVRK